MRRLTDDVLPPLGDYVRIHGSFIPFDDLLNEEFFSQGSILDLAKSFRSAQPFQHMVVDGLFSPQLLDLINSEFDELNWRDWVNFDNINERKLGSQPFPRLGRASQLYFSILHSGKFVDFLTQITGIAGLVPDPSLKSGGLHEIPSGGRFRHHLDFNKHNVTNLDNRLVFITYLNRDWRRSYGGALELWNIAEDKCGAEIEPIFGRSVMFYQSSISMHGHPTPVSAPNGRARRSIAAYFYSNGRSDEKLEPHSTIYGGPPITRSRREKLSSAIRSFTPPIIVHAIRKLKKSGTFSQPSY